MHPHEALQVLERLRHLHLAYLREFSYRMGLNLRQLECLIYLRDCNRYSDTALALTDYLGLTKGTVSQTIISLEDKGLLKKYADASDGRIIHLKLTRKAEKLLEECARDSPLERVFTKANEVPRALARKLTAILIEVQRANKSKTFGACYSCTFFRPNGLESSHQCGLTHEPLSDHESLKICREHNAL